MSHTFDVRFARSQGLAALFEAPANSFLWKGDGRLSIDDAGISIVVKRSLSSLFSRRRSHRIAAGELTEVYREGEALRLEFGSNLDRRVLPLWVDDSEKAARIVKLLPTSHTVELEHATQPPRRFRLHKRMAILMIVLVAIAAAVMALVKLPAPVAVESPGTEGGALPAVATAVPPATIATPAAPVTIQPDIARRQQDLFESELKGLRDEYFSLLGRDASQTPERLEPRWWTVRFQLDPEEPTTGPAFTGYREAQLAVVTSWNSAVSLLAAGLRLRDERLIELAQKQRQLAEQQEHIVRQYVH